MSFKKVAYLFGFSGKQIINQIMAHIVAKAHFYFHCCSSNLSFGKRDKEKTMWLLQPVRFQIEEFYWLLPGFYINSVFYNNVVSWDRQSHTRKPFRPSRGEPSHSYRTAFLALNGIYFPACRRHCTLLYQELHWHGHHLKKDQGVP